MGYAVPTFALAELFELQLEAVELRLHVQQVLCGSDLLLLLRGESVSRGLQVWLCGEDSAEPDASSFESQRAGSEEAESPTESEHEFAIIIESSRA